MSVANGESANATNFNNSFMSRETDTSTVGKVDLNDPDSGTSGATVENVQRSLNGQGNFTGADPEGAATQSPSWTSDAIGTPNEDIKSRVDAVQAQVETNDSDIDTKVDLVSPSTDHAIPRFDGVGGAMQDSGVTIDDSDNVTIPGDLTVSGTTTTINTSTLDVEDANITVNNGGDQSTADSNVAGLTVEMSDATDARIGYDSSTTSKFKCGESGSEVEIADISSSQVITNKDIDGGTATDTNRITLPKETTSNLNGLSDKEGTLAYDTSKGAPVYNDGAGWNDIGTGEGSGFGINYISGNNSDAETTIGDWVAYDDGAVDTPVDGTGGSPGISIARTTTGSEILRGNASFEITKPGADHQGEGVSVDFIIDPRDQGRQLEISFDYKIQGAGTYASSDLQVFVYDVTNTNIIGLVDDYSGQILSPASEGSTFVSKFNAASDSTSYRLIFHIATATTEAFNFIFDTVRVGPQNSVPGTFASRAIDFTPTGAWSTNTTYSGKWYRISNRMYCEITLDTSGAPDAVALTLNLPSGYVIDTDAMDDPSVNLTPLGRGSLNESGVSSYRAEVYYNDTTSVRIHPYQDDVGAGSSYVGTGQTVTNAIPFAWGAGDSGKFWFDVPILGWQSSASINTQQNSLLNVQVNTNDSTPAGTLAAAFNTTVFDTVSTDTHSAYNTSTGVFTCPVGGLYYCALNLEMSNTASAGIAAARVTNTTTGRFHVNEVIDLGTSETRNCPTVSGLLECSAGDVIEAQAYNSFTSPSYSNTNGGSSFSIFLVPDFQQFSVFGEHEYLESELTTTQNTSAADTYLDAATAGGEITLSPGVWEIGYNILLTITRVAGAAIRYANVVITDSSNTIVDNTHGGTAAHLDATTTIHVDNVSRKTEITVTADTTYKIRIRCDVAAANAVANVTAQNLTGGLTNPDNNSMIFARRMQ